MTGISYDADGNIETLTREGILSVSPEGCPVYGTIDELDYTYSGNRVTSISEMQATKGFYVPSGTASVSYTYHPDGNLLSDNGKGITQIDYNYLNLPSEILIPGKTLLFTYDASGTKWSKEGLDLDGQTSTYDYAMGVEYQDNQIIGVYHSAGRAAIDPETSEWRHEFHVRDHLGNLRVAITEDLDVLDAVDYYPFGMRYGQGLTLQQQSQIWPLRKDTVPGEDHFYNGKEYQFDRIGYDTDGTVVELGWYDYGARFYDPSVGRFTGVDPLANDPEQIDKSPYAAMWNNPIRLLDPDGRKVINGDEAARDQAQKARNRAQTEFNKNYASADLRKKSFTSKSEWKSYKSARNDLKSKQKAFDKAQATYEHTQQSTDNFAAVDPTNFAIADNLTYTNKAGDTKTVDIIVASGEASEYGGGVTSFSVTDLGNIGGNVINTTIGLNISVTANVLAHEFGHGSSIAADPVGYYDAVVPNHNCQDPANRNHVLSKTALDWQERYDRLYKDYKKKNK